MSKKLAEEIYRFLNKHGKRTAEDQNEWSSPDAAEMEIAALNLQKGKIYYPHSNWESGGYHPYSSVDGRKWHDDILQKIKETIPLRNKKFPKPRQSAYDKLADFIMSAPCRHCKANIMKGEKHKKDCLYNQ